MFGTLCFRLILLPFKALLILVLVSSRDVIIPIPIPILANNNTDTDQYQYQYPNTVLISIFTSLPLINSTFDKHTASTTFCSSTKKIVKADNTARQKSLQCEWSFSSRLRSLPAHNLRSIKSHEPNGLTVKHTGSRFDSSCFLLSI